MSGRGGSLTNAVAVARAVLLDVDVHVLGMRRIGPWPEYRDEPPACGDADGIDRSTQLFISIRFDAQDFAIRELEARDADRQTGRMRADFADLCAVAVAAFVTRFGVNRLEFDREIAGNERSDEIAQWQVGTTFKVSKRTEVTQEDTYKAALDRIELSSRDARLNNGRVMQHMEMKMKMLQGFVLFVMIALVPVVAIAQSSSRLSAKVEKVDESANKVTLNHGAIPELDMPAMTMVYKAQDPKMLKSVKAGDKVKFSIEKLNRQLAVTKVGKPK